MKLICKIMNGDKYWVIPNTENHKLSYLDLGVLHREDGPAIDCSSGNKFWYFKGRLHRKDGPAVEKIGGYKAWYFHDKHHRENGPATEWHDNDIDWYSNGESIKPTSKMMEKYIRLNPDNILKNYPYPLEIQILAINLKPGVIFDIKYPDERLKELYPKLYALKDSGLI